MNPLIVRAIYSPVQPKNKTKTKQNKQQKQKTTKDKQTHTHTHTHAHTHTHTHTHTHAQERAYASTQKRASIKKMSIMILIKYNCDVKLGNNGGGWGVGEGVTLVEGGWKDRRCTNLTHTLTHSLTLSTKQSMKSYAAVIGDSCNTNMPKTKIPVY